VNGSGEVRSTKFSAIFTAAEQRNDAAAMRLSAGMPIPDPIATSVRLIVQSQIADEHHPIA
jgi:hypothetical protein